MLALLLLTAGVVGASFAAGQGAAALCGCREWRPWAPALGYGILLVLGGQALRMPGDAVGALVLIGLALAVSLALPAARAALGGDGLRALALAAPLIAVAATPFFAAGYVGALGASVSNDMSTHLLGAFWVRTGDSLRPMAAIGGDIVSTGYPMGPHGLVAALTALTGAGEETTFSAITIAVPVLTAIAALGLVPASRRPARWGLATAVGFAYLPIAYTAQGSFKETIQALLVFAGAVALGDLVRGRAPAGLRRGVPLGVFAGAAVYTYSYGGVFWLAGAALVLLALEVARRPRELASLARAAAAPAAVAVAVASVAAAPEIPRVVDFTSSIFGVEPKKNQGNLFDALNPLESLGVWLSGDFRLNPDPIWPSIALSAAALGVLLWSIAWWWRRRALALPAAALAALVIWVDLAVTRNIYNAAKGLVVLAPLLTASLGAPLAAAWERPGRRRSGSMAMRATGVVLLAAALASSFAALRSAPVGPGAHERELAGFRALIGRQPVLFLSNDHFAQWELRGADLKTTGPLYAPARLAENPQKNGGFRIDVDNYGSPELDRVRFIVTPAGAYASQIPPNFELIRRTASFGLYRRNGRTPLREPIEPPGAPGAVFDCGSARGKDYLRRYAWAGVVPRPVVTDRWQGSIAVPGAGARTTVALPAGRWDVSLQFESRTALEVRAPGLRTTIPASFGSIAAYWPAGTLTSRGGSVTLSLTARKRTWFGRLAGGPVAMRAPSAPGNAPLWHVAFTRHGITPRRVRSRAACGRYVDWFAPAGGTMRGRSVARDEAVRAS